jgi:hypothetical protein
MSFPPDNQEDFDKLVEEYSGKENTACIFAAAKYGGNPNQGIIGDAIAVMVLLVMLIRQIAKNIDGSFSDVLGALAEINTMDDFQKGE